MVRLITLGATDVYGSLRKIPAGRPFAALIILAQRRKAVSRQELVELLWDAGAVRTERHALSQLLYWLKSFLPPETLVTTDTEVALANATDDFTEFLKAFRSRNYVEAASLYGGGFLSGFPIISEAFEAWRTECAATAETAVVQTYRALVEEKLDSNDHASIPDLCARALQIARHDAFFIRAQIEALAATNIEAALASFESQRQLLLRETGAAPGWMTDEHIRRIAAADAIGSPTDYEDVEVPFVGRVEHLRALRRVWQQSAVDVQTVRLMGEAGVGKSRLLKHFLRRTALEGARVHLHACTESETLVPYAAVAGLLLSNHRGDVIAELPSQLQDALISVAPELSANTAFGQYHQRVVFEAFAQYFTLVAAKHRLVLAVDDYQWSDEVSRAALNYVMRRLPAPGCLLIMAARSDIPAPTPDNSSVTVIVEPMRADEVDRLVEYHEKAYSKRFHGYSIYERTGGNPFFVLQLLQYLNENPDASPTSFTDAAVPASVSRILGSRLRKLSDIARRTATSAAVINHVASLALLSDVSGMGELDVANGIDELVRLGIVQDRHGCQFVHDLMRQATYQSTSVTLRRLLHQRAAAALEKGDAVHSELAFHFELGGDAHKAWEHARAAADEAVRLYAYREADAQFQRMQRCAVAEKTEQTQAEYLSFLCRCNRLVDGYAYVDAVESYAITSSNRELGVLCRLVRSVRDSSLSLQAALELIEEAQQSCPEQLPKVIRYAVEVIRGNGEADLRAFGDMLRQEVRGTAAVHRHATAGLIIGIIDGYEDALPIAERAVALATEVRDPAALLAALFVRGVARTLAGMCNAALDDYHEVLNLSDQTGSVDFTVQTASNLSVVYLEQDLHDSAEEWAHRALQPETTAKRPFAAGNLVLIFYRRGDYRTARKYIDIMESSPTREIQKWIAVQALTFRGLCSVAEADWELALKIERELTRSAKLEGLPVDLSTIHEFVGQVIGYRDGARQAEAYLLQKSAETMKFDYFAGARLALLATSYFQPSQADRVEAVARPILERASSYGAAAIATQASRVLQSVHKLESRKPAKNR